MRCSDSLPRQHRSLWVLAVVAAGVVVGRGLYAQEITGIAMADDTAVAVYDPEVRRTLAEGLGSRAASFLREGRSVEAAVLYRESARLRTEDDSRAVGHLRIAARLFHHANLPERAIATFQEAAARAAAASPPDLVTAATAHLEAGFVANAMGDERQAGRLAARAVAIATSPELDAEQRSAITRRILLYSPAVTGPGIGGRRGPDHSKP